LLREPGRKNYGMEDLRRREGARNPDPAPLSEQQIQKALFANLRQRGAPLDAIRRALLRDAHGRASSPLGAALDLLAERSS
jgi:hypothetical protein